MLIRFAVTNFLSFRDAIEFSTVATREKQHANRLFVDNEREMKLLPLAAVYGANGSGKSNFYKAIEFVQKLVLDPAQTPENSISVKPFRLDETSENEPSRFSIELISAENTVFRLSFAVTARAIVEESLEIIGVSSSKSIYRRTVVGTEVDWDLKYFQREAVPAEERDFIFFKARDTLPNQLFLSTLRGRGIKPAEEVIGWFRDVLQLMTPNTVLKLLEINLGAVSGLRLYCIEALKKSDTGIFGIDRAEVPISALPVPQEVFAEMQRVMQKEVPKGRAMLVATPDGKRFTLEHDENGIHAFRLLTIHRTGTGKEVKFLMEEESDGTQRFIDLLPAFYDLANSSKPRVFVIDEIDRSLHTELTRHLLEAFLQTLTTMRRSQLIFTTHDVMLLDQGILRRDEIWFTEKSSDGNSEMFGLSDFKDVRADKDIRKSYLLGRYGGMPRILGFPSHIASPEEADLRKG